MANSKPADGPVDFLNIETHVPERLEYLDKTDRQSDIIQPVSTQTNLSSKIKRPFKLDQRETQ